MSSASESPYQRRQVSARRQHRIDLARAHTHKLIRQRIGWYHDRGFPAEKIANSVGVPLEEVIDQISEQ